MRKVVTIAFAVLVSGMAPAPDDVGYDFTDSNVVYDGSYDTGVFGSGITYDNSFTNSPIEPACK